MVITDLYDHVIDEKNRLAIPTQIRNAMDPQVDGTAFYLVPEIRYLQLIPENMFRRLAEKNPSGLFQSPAAAKAARYLFANSPRLEPDKAGRVIIPDRFMADSANALMLTQSLLRREVTLVGVNDHVELWNRKALMAHMQELVQDRSSFEDTLHEKYGMPLPPPAHGADGNGESPAK